MKNYLIGLMMGTILTVIWVNYFPIGWMYEKGKADGVFQFGHALIVGLNKK